MRTRSRRLRLAIGLLLGTLTFGAFTASPNEARASITERVVAIVGERPILLSELRQRARPHLRHYAAAETTESEVLKAILQRMIDERLEETAAARANVVVTPEEIDRALQAIAIRGQITPAQLVAEATKQGLTEQEYRDEVRRQLLEGKLVQLRVRVRVTEDDARAAYAVWTRETSSTAPFEAVRERMLERAADEALTRARNAWLRDLRRQTFVEVRL